MESECKQVRAIVKKRVIRIVITALLVMPAALFLFLGFRWLVAPERAVAALLMPLLRGSGLGSQMGDIGGMFLAIGLIVMGAVITQRGSCLVPVSVLLGCIVLFRLLAFALYAAPLAPQALAVELVLSGWFAFASRMMGTDETAHG